MAELLRATRLQRLNGSLKLLRDPPEGKAKEEVLFTKEELTQATQRGFELYKGHLAGQTSHDNIPGINLAFPFLTWLEMPG